MLKVPIRVWSVASVVIAVANCGVAACDDPGAAAASPTSPAISKTEVGSGASGARVGRSAAAGGRPRAAAAGPPVIAGLAPMTVAQLRAQVGRFEHGAIVNLWASFCGSCQRELPMLAEVARAYREHGLGLVLITADDPPAFPKAKALLEQSHISDPAFYLASLVSTFRKEVEPRWKGAVPATLLVDREGRVRYFWNGPVTAAEISPVVQGYLAGDAIDGMTDVVGE